MLPSTALDTSFEALAHPTRREILQFVMAHPGASINLIAEQFGVSRPAISKHIKLLKQGGFVAITDNGRVRNCTVSPSGFEAIKGWMNYYDQFWAQKLGTLAQLLDAESPKKQG